MEIRQFRVVVRVSSFERGLKFYGDALALPKIQSWERDDQRGVVFLAGSSLIEMLGPPAGEDPRLKDERYNSQGPRGQATLVLDVPSAQQAFEEIFSREKNIPGGLQEDDQGRMTFVTHDPDNLRVIFREMPAS